MKSTGEKVEGCLAGCAVGDALGLPFEGLTPRRIHRLLRDRPLNHRFVFGRGMVSDDTDHSIFVAEALSTSNGHVTEFQRLLGWKLKLWLACLPAGIGFATLRAILKLWLGFPGDRSGVFSAGNGPAMRSAVIGATLAGDDAGIRALVRSSTRLTHTDPKAENGALAIALVASKATKEWSRRPALEELEELLGSISDQAEWAEAVSRTITACRAGEPVLAIPESLRIKGVSGYVYHTVPVALSAWYVHHGDFRKTVESVVRLGGDTDTVAAIAGALAGTVSGVAGIPQEWIGRLADFPHGLHHISQISLALSQPSTDRQTFSFSPVLFPRGILFTLLVLGHGARRLFPPW